MTTYTSKALVDLIKTESELLKEYVSALAPEELERPSPCELWDVGEVIAHLMWFAETYGGMMKRGLRGDLSPAEGFPAEPGTLRGPDIAELYGRSAIELRRRMGQELLPAFCERYDWLNAILQGIGPTIGTNPAIAHSGFGRWRALFRSSSPSWPSTNGMSAPPLNPRPTCRRTAFPPS